MLSRSEAELTNGHSSRKRSGQTDEPVNGSDRAA